MANISNLWWKQGKPHPLKGLKHPRKRKTNNIPNRKGTYKNCIHCNNNFYATKDSEVCCSLKCSLDSGHRAKTISNGKGNKTGWVTPKNALIRESEKYKAWRKSVYKRDNYTCQECGTKGGELNAHHIKSFALYPKLRFKLSNGKTLCLSCHKQTDTYGSKQRNSKGQFIKH